jgi:cAMP-dependent protein kinase regulator
MTNKGRAATVICKEDCILATLDKKSYDTLVGLSMKEKINIKSNYLKNISFLKTAKPYNMLRLTYYMEEKKFQKGQYVYREGDNAEGVYFVRYGEFEMNKQSDSKNL